MSIVLDIPTTAIKNHKTATPYLGGVAVFIGMIVALVCAFTCNCNQLFFFVGITLLLCVGLIDDLIVIKPIQKFSGQIVAALCFFKAGIHFQEQFFLNKVFLWPVSLLWILTISNAFNLIDN